MSTFFAYVLMMLSLALSVIASFWVLMDFKASCVCTFIFIFGMLQWWRYCLRIYNRFFVDPITEDALQFESSETMSERARSFDRQYSRTSSTGIRHKIGISDGDMRAADNYAAKRYSNLTFSIRNNIYTV
jgi:hypothetical protein